MSSKLWVEYIQWWKTKLFEHTGISGVVFHKLFFTSFVACEHRCGELIGSA